jgi:flagella basal body P-ring formation protein FlgA
MNGRRQLTRRQAVRLLVALTILAWATQTLLAQWGLGAVSPATLPSEPLFGGERFVPGSQRFEAGATVELRGEATVVGEEVTLRQVCRWTAQDEPVLAPIADLVLARLGEGTPFRSIDVTQIKELLRDGGVNIAALNFVGAAACTVNRSDVEYDERLALSQWISAREAAAAATQQVASEPPAASLPATAPADALAMTNPEAASLVESPADDNPVRSLRRMLVEDLSRRLLVPAQNLQVDFRAEDQKLLSMSEPLFRFAIEPVRVRDLGEVCWRVQIAADAKTQTATVRAHARAWQNQVVLARPLAIKQVIRDEDVIERRTLAEKLSPDPLVRREEVVGQQASRELSVGTVLTARMIDPVQLVKAGQYVTISLRQGNVHVRSVAKAMEAGSYGQTIRVKNDTTRETFQVVITGPQMATMSLHAAPVAGRAPAETNPIAAAGE